MGSRMVADGSGRQIVRLRSLVGLRAARASPQLLRSASVRHPHPSAATREALMDEDRFNMSVRKFLKVVGVTSQREIENAVREVVKAGRLSGGGTLKAKATLTIESVGLTHQVEEDIELG